MATVLGKRKARNATASEAPAISPEEAQEMLRRHFEAQFQPLDVVGGAADRKDVDGIDDDRSEASNAEEDDDDDDDDEEEEDTDDDDDDDEWDGLSDSDANQKTPAAPPIEVVEHVSVPNPSAGARADPALKRVTKAYLSSRVPTASSLSAATPGPSSSKGKGGGEDDESSAALLRNDLALQRLLSESHLFTQSPLGGGGGGGAAATMEHAGRNRHLATDLRLAALGSKGSIYKQAKMPMAHRKGIIAAAETREARRRREARENGIVLEKPTAGVHEGWTGLKNAAKQRKKTAGGAGGSRMRDAAVDAPAVGKLRNGMLQLSKKDVQTIQGDGGRTGAGRGGGKRRRR